MCAIIVQHAAAEGGHPTAPTRTGHSPDTEPEEVKATEAASDGTVTATSGGPRNILVSAA